MSDVLGNALLKLSAPGSAAAAPAAPVPAATASVANALADSNLAMSAADSVTARTHIDGAAVVQAVSGPASAGAVISISAIEDGSLGQLMFETSTSSGASWNIGHVIELLRARVYNRRRQLAAVTVLMVMAGL